MCGPLRSRRNYSSRGGPSVGPAAPHRPLPATGLSGEGWQPPVQCRCFHKLMRAECAPQAMMLDINCDRKLDHNYLNEDRVNYSGNLKVLSV